MLNKIRETIAVIASYVKSHDISFNEYFIQNQFISPVALEHICGGFTSIYFYAALSPEKAYRLLDYPDDVYEDLMQCSKNDFFETVINPARDRLNKIESAREFAYKLDRKI